ncbi:mediator of RNA polymerase II transcription subunit 11 isoform X2 [Lycium ferocissimum]|uniref:mediator of RNA polymerase II transcription subunit 11 isoform X2 n=1 Tax=Lycium ferocissimum TaxID=112874 RepID=UPI00281537BB|nr:mediator of RNA polymerase II transcription subunit 11 isoform X2 [Lycium ferocissimum]
MPLLWDSVSKILFNFSTLARSSALQFSHLFNTMDSQSQNTSLQRLQNVEKRIVRVLELAGGVMDEMANPSGPRKELIDSHCSEFMQLIKDIQVTLREEIKSACEYRPFEKCDYVPRISNEICCKKLEYVISQFDDMKRTIEGYHAASLDNMALD